jgi:hypothetical protein
MLKTEKHQLEGLVTSAETYRDSVRFALKKEQAVLSDAEKVLSILKTKKHQLEGCVTSAETERDSVRFALKKE